MGKKPIGILLIEDNPGDARLIKEMLIKNNEVDFTLSDVGCFADGLKYLLEEKVALVITDLNLPDSKALATITSIRMQKPDIPIIALTGAFEESLGIEAVQAGAQDYLLKDKLNSYLLVRSIRYAIERKHWEEQLTYAATHDPLTDLPNRRLFNDRLSVAISLAQRNEQKLAVMMLDLDDFKVVNDTWGHAVGDELLKCMGKRLSSLLRKSDSIARMGGDEFIFLLLDIKDGINAAAIAQKILEISRKPFIIEEHKIYISMSIGIAIFPNDTNDSQSLIRIADRAMYYAKNSGKDNYKLYSILEEG